MQLKYFFKDGVYNKKNFDIICAINSLPRWWNW